MHRLKYLLTKAFPIVLCLWASVLFGQKGARISGALQSNVNIFLRDTSINAYLQPQYQTQIFGNETWFNLNYSYKTLSAGIRYDVYIHSNLRDPNASYSDNGLGRWFIKNKYKNLTAEVGYLYGQVGSGIIYRAYEQRPLFIDNALVGASLQYKFSDALSIKTFAGRQKNAFDIYTGTIKGAVLDGFFSFGSEENPVNIIPGIGFINKTLSQESMTKVVNSLKTYLPADRFRPIYNTYATTLYNTINYKKINWYAEAAFKTDDIFYNSFAVKQEFGGNTTFGKFVYKPGSVLYSSVSYAGDKLSVTLEGKRTKNFSFRIDPSVRLLRGLISYIPPMNRQNTYRLNARYSPAAQEISEQAIQADIRYNVSKKTSVLFNHARINTIEGDKLFREYLLEATYKPSSKTQIISGLQYQNYNQSIYEQKPEVPLLQSVTPYVDVLYKITPKKSIRTEIQYMATQQDFGSWFYALAEYGIAPHWIFEASGMYNTDPKKTLGNNTKLEKTLYPSLGVVYSKNANRYQLRYVKQVEGVVCSGGICRLEPAFSGVRFTINSTF
jgi:hypothetical protein